VAGSGEMNSRSCARAITAAGVATVVAALGLPARAHADHPAIARAIEYAEDADFASALAAFEEAESARSLGRDELVRLYAHRATVQFALGQTPAMEADLRRLVALDPHAALPASAPPPVGDALDALRAEPHTPEIDADARAIATGAEIRASVREGRADLVRGLRAWGRRDTGEWESGEGGAVTIDAVATDTVLWYAEALGPGGVVVASHGTRTAPLSLTMPAPSAVAGGDDSLTWWLVGGGSAAIVVGAVVTGVVLALGAGGSSTTTTLGGPTYIP
jgi:hypothetical protein